MARFLDRIANPYVILAIGLMAVSTAAILIRLAQEEAVSSLVIAAARLIVATLVLTPIVLQRYQHQLQKLERGDLLLCGLSGLVLGGHFAAWISSLEYTSVVASVVLVTTSPLFVALLSAPLLNEPISRAVLMGIVLAFIGGGIVAVSGDAGEPPTRPEPLLGNGLAIIGAIAVALYFIIGRRVRAKLAVIPYIWLVYGVAAVVLSGVVMLRGEQVGGFEPIAYIWLIALGLIPQLIGHSAFNYALGYFPAAYVSLIVLGEPIGSGLLAALFLDEIPTPLAMFGAALILVGIAVATRKQKEAPSDVEI